MAKRVTATEARKNWFRLLDEVAAGEEVVIERHGWRIVLRRVAPSRDRERPDYSALIRAPDVEGADGWSWRWSGPEGELEPADPEGDDR
jgi:antitoxin (DNA-binding transcriptional repressor) of toxin-antitoxin stability system